MKTLPHLNAAGFDLPEIEADIETEAGCFDIGADGKIEAEADLHRNEAGFAMKTAFENEAVTERKSAERVGFPEEPIGNYNNGQRVPPVDKHYK